jgi:hypothetical protein
MSNINTFSPKTPLDLQSLIKSLNDSRERVRVFYGDTLTGRAWPEENDTMGRVGCSMGHCKVPLLIYNARSYGGSALLDGCIVAIYSTTGRKIYKHPNFSTGSFSIIHTLPRSDKLDFTVTLDGVTHARFSTMRQAQRYADFMHGVRFSK